MTNSTSSRFGLPAFAFVTLIGCTDDVASGDEVVDDTSDTSTSTDESEGDSGTTETDGESGDTDATDSLDATTTDTGSESDSTSDGESTTEGDSTTDEESTTEGDSTTDEESTTEEESTSDEESTTETGGNDFECGDGVVQVAEACDDGNDIGGDGCEADCTLSVTLDWVVVRDPMNGTACSSIHRMEFRPDGDLATAGTSKISQFESTLFVAAWTADAGDILAEHVGDSPVHENKQPNLDSLANGDLLVSRASDAGFNSVGTIWRFGPDLELELTAKADELDPDKPLAYDAVIGTAGGGMLALSTSPWERVFRLDAQGQFVEQVTSYGYFEGVDLVRISDDEMWWFGRDLDFDIDSHVGIVRRLGIADLEQVGPETSWFISPPNIEHYPAEIEHRGIHTVAAGPVPNPDDLDPNMGVAGLWRFDAEGELIASHTIDQFGNLWVEGLAIAEDGTLVVAARSVAFGVGLDGELLWHVSSGAIEGGAEFFDALVDDEGNVYLGGRKFVDFDCYAAVLARIAG